MKSAREIFSVFSQQSDDKGITLTWSSKDSITKALRDLEIEIDRIIGEDAEPDIVRPAGVKDGKRQYTPSYSLRATFINETKAKQRQRLREFLEGDLNI